MIKYKRYTNKAFAPNFFTLKTEFLCIIFVNSKYKCDVDLKHVADQDNKRLIYPRKIYL